MGWNCKRIVNIRNQIDFDLGGNGTYNWKGMRRQDNEKLTEAIACSKNETRILDFLCSNGHTFLSVGNFR